MPRDGGVSCSGARAPVQVDVPSQSSKYSFSHATSLERRTYSTQRTHYGRSGLGHVRKSKLARAGEASDRRSLT